MADSSKVELPFETELYSEAIRVWPPNGRHILACFTNTSIIVFQAYKPSISEWVCSHQSFQNCPGFSTERMTWIKPNFLWMMYRSGWASKPDQERILAITLKREGFEELLIQSKRRVEGEDQSCTRDDEVRLQWDPDHDPFGTKVERRAIQLGIRGATLKKYLDQWIISIHDITNFVKEQFSFVQNNELHLLRVPVQRVYNISDETIRNRLGLEES